MAIQIVPYADAHRAAVRRFSEQIWRRPRSERYYRWRYEQPAFQRAWLALRDGECLAMECAIERPYRMGDQQLDVLEVFDWYVLPELRNAGLGVRVMQALMHEPHPLMLVGGSPDTQALLPRLKWQRVATSTRWVLSLGAERLRQALAQRMRLPGALAGVAAQLALRRPGLRPRPRCVPPGGRVQATASVGDEMHALYRGAIGHGTLPLWTDALLRWLQDGFPGVGHFVPLYFSVGERLVGWSLLRIFSTPLGCDAEIIELFTPQPDAELYTWMISETACVAAGFSPGIVGGRTTCAAIEQAFARNRFVRTSSDPVHFWLGDRPTPPAPITIGSNTNDAAFVPMVERWWDDAGDAQLGVAR